MCEGISSATPRPAAHESRASTGSRRSGLAPRPPILREPGRPAVATSRETRRPRSALGQTRVRGGGRHGGGERTARTGRTLERAEGTEGTNKEKHEREERTAGPAVPEAPA